MVLSKNKSKEAGWDFWASLKEVEYHLPFLLLILIVYLISFHRSLYLHSNMCKEKKIPPSGLNIFTSQLSSYIWSLETRAKHAINPCVLSAAPATKAWQWGDLGQGPAGLVGSCALHWEALAALWTLAVTHRMTQQHLLCSLLDFKNL